MKRIVIDKDSKDTIAIYWTVSVVLAVLAILFIHPLWALIPILLFLVPVMIAVRMISLRRN